MKDHIEILEQAAKNELPESIHGKSEISYQAVLELIMAGHLNGVHAMSVDGMAIFMPAITLSGRQFLAENKKISGFSGWIINTWYATKPLWVWMAGILAAVIVAYLTKLLGLL